MRSNLSYGLLFVMGAVTTVSASALPALASAVSSATDAAASACATNLPEACQTIATEPDLAAVVQQIPACQTALGPYNTGDAANCLVVSTPYVTGAVIYNCLVIYLSPQCITGLPDSCTALQGTNGSTTVAGIPDCATALGPFNNNVTAPCLDTTDSTTGDSVLSCLDDSLGLTA